MGILADQDRQEAWAEYMRRTPIEENFGIFTKPDLRAALNAVDQWVSDNEASFNTAIPQPCRAQLTKSQKARLLLFIVEKRYLKGV